MDAFNRPTRLLILVCVSALVSGCAVAAEEKAAPAIRISSVERMFVAGDAASAQGTADETQTKSVGNSVKAAATPQAGGATTRPISGRKEAVARGLLAVIDLSQPGLRVVATGAVESVPAKAVLMGDTSARLRRTDTWAKENKVAVAVNANYFGWIEREQGEGGLAKTMGLLVSDGKLVNPTRKWNEVPDPAVVFVRDETTGGLRAVVIGPGAESAVQSRQALEQQVSRARQAAETSDVGVFYGDTYVGGGKLGGARIVAAVAGIGGGGSDGDKYGGTVLLREGQNLGLDTRVVPTRRVARTAAGVDVTGRKLFLLVVDGSQPGWSDGVTLPELADWLHDLGASDAVNLDGGGSSTFVYRGADGGYYRNRPSHAAVGGQPGRVRPVAVQLGFVSDAINVEPATKAVPVEGEGPGK